MGPLAVVECYCDSSPPWISGSCRTLINWMPTCSAAKGLEIKGGSWIFALACELFFSLRTCVWAMRGHRRRQKPPLTWRWPFKRCCLGGGVWAHRVFLKGLELESRSGSCHHTGLLKPSFIWMYPNWVVMKLLHLACVEVDLHNWCCPFIMNDLWPKQRTEPNAQRNKRIPSSVAHGQWSVHVEKHLICMFVNLDLTVAALLLYTSSRFCSSNKTSAVPNPEPLEVNKER